MTKIQGGRPQTADLRGWRYPGDHQPGRADRFDLAVLTWAAGLLLGDAPVRGLRRLSTGLRAGCVFADGPGEAGVDRLACLLGLGRREELNAVRRGKLREERGIGRDRLGQPQGWGWLARRGDELVEAAW